MIDYIYIQKTILSETAIYFIPCFYADNLGHLSETETENIDFKKIKI